MHPGWMWLIAGVILLIVEVLGTTFFLIWIAAAALVTALLSIWVPSAGIQWLVFAIVSTALLLLTRPLVHRLRNATVAPSNVDSLVGQTAVVLEAIDNHRNTGRVRVGSDQWRARSEATIPQDARVIIRRIEGTTLWVEALPDPEA